MHLIISAYRCRMAVSVEVRLDPAEGCGTPEAEATMCVYACISKWPSFHSRYPANVMDVVSEKHSFLLNDV